MILNPSHLLLNMANVDQLGPLMDNLKAKLVFSDNVPIPKPKKTILHGDYSANRLRYFGFDGSSCEIEVVEHPQPSNIHGNLFPLFGKPADEGGMLADENELTCVSKAFSIVTGKPVCTLNTCGLVTFHQETGHDGVHMTLSFADDLEKKADFFIRALEFKEVNQDANPWRILQCNSKISKNKMTVCLKRSEALETTRLIRPQFIDDNGFTGMSFLVSNLENHLKRVNQMGFGNSLCDIEVTVNGREMLCSFLRDPEGQLIELFQIKNPGTPKKDPAR